MPPEREPRDALYVAIALGIVLTLGDVTAVRMKNDEAQSRQADLRHCVTVCDSVNPARTSPR